MPRRAEIPPRPLVADPIYNSPLVTQVINKVMKDGKKSTAEAIVYKALDHVGDERGDLRAPAVAGTEEPEYEYDQECRRQRRRDGEKHHRVRIQLHDPPRPGAAAATPRSAAARLLPRLTVVGFVGLAMI